MSLVFVEGGHRGKLYGNQKERKTSCLKSSRQTLMLNADITSGATPAYFCDIAIVFPLSGFGFFPHVETHTKGKIKETLEEKRKKKII